MNLKTRIKILKTVLLVCAILFGLTLWWTRSDDFQSLSAYSLSPNAIYYRFMHLSMFAFFLLNAHYKKYATEYILALLVGFILAFDMYHDTDMHNISTVGLVLLACFTLLFNAKDSLKIGIALALSISSVVVFCIGYFTSFHHLFAEIIVMACLSTGKLIEIHNE